MLWARKLNALVNRVTGDCVTFVDNTRVTMCSVETFWQHARRPSSVMQCIGTQGSEIKRKPPSLNSGAWDGGISQSNGEAIYRATTQEKGNNRKWHLGDFKSRIGTKEDPKLVD